MPNFDLWPWKNVFYSQILPWGIFPLFLWIPSKWGQFSAALHIMVSVFTAPLSNWFKPGSSLTNRRDKSWKQWCPVKALIGCVWHMGSPQTKRQILETVPGSQSPQITSPLGCLLLCSLLHKNACMIESMSIVLFTDDISQGSQNTN